MIYCFRICTADVVRYSDHHSASWLYRMGGTNELPTQHIHACRRLGESNPSATPRRHHAPTSSPLRVPRVLLSPLRGIASTGVSVVQRRLRLRRVLVWSLHLSASKSYARVLVWVISISIEITPRSAGQGCVLRDCVSEDLLLSVGRQRRSQLRGAMSGPTRPIPISHGHRSQRGSPVSSADASDMISQSAPVNGHGAPFFGPSAHRQQRPPRAPVIGSLPEPSFMMAEGGDAMPELALPPPAHVDHDTGSLSSTPGRTAVIHVASSCPSDLGFFRQGFGAQQRSWTPSPRASDEFDLSKSPALAVMSAMRQGRRRPSFDLRRCDEEPSEDEEEQTQQQHTPQYPPHQTPSQSHGIVGRRISDPPFRAAPSNSFVSSSQFYFQDDRMNAELHSQQLAMESLSLGGSSASSELGSSSEGVSIGLPPRRPERRGSYDGGIFHFEDQ